MAEQAEKVGEARLTPSLYKDPKTGRILPGSPGGPGRPPKAKEDVVLNLMRVQVPAQKVVDTILELLDHPSSWRARESGVRLYMDYMVGTPVRRSVTASTKLETLLNRLGEMSEDEFQVVESSYKNA